MKAVFQTILGLIIDDWWLAAGILLSIVLTGGLLDMNVSPSAGAWVLTVLTLLTLILSLTMEYRRKTR
ncbi:hypothetical protein [Paenibacillus piri]|uniref:Uncharacterized protein n=1 Tax=Paenibacillus piri TaxID=2547395 RepID=A0A4R5KQT0_9BACL|nr:hypothetical protein [Paenibacillus piri]TDF98101.1 hypothetical protein E1757_11380 [Paenibacillus piri]